jgi:hypothetical protein
MTKGESRNVNLFLKYISDEDRVNVDEFVLNGLIRDYTRCSSVHEVREGFSIPGYITYDQATDIRSFTGTNYFDINSALRGRWNYHENGNDSRKDAFLMQATKIKSIISNNSTSYGDFISYRGVSLSYFSEYGIECLDDLMSLEGKFMIDSGLVSTTLLPEQSFFGKSIEGEKKYNVMIEYMVPKEFTDGIYIGDNSNFSYHPHEQEYLINAGNMSKVTGVRINDDGTARIQAVMVPKSLYDNYYKNKGSNTK